MPQNTEAEQPGPTTCSLLRALSIVASEEIIRYQQYPFPINFCVSIVERLILPQVYMLWVQHTREYDEQPTKPKKKRPNRGKGKKQKQLRFQLLDPASNATPLVLGVIPRPDLPASPTTTGAESTPGLETEDTERVFRGFLEQNQVLENLPWEEVKKKNRCRPSQPQALLLASAVVVGTKQKATSKGTHSRPVKTKTEHTAAIELTSTGTIQTSVPVATFVDAPLPCPESVPWKIISVSPLDIDKEEKEKKDFLRGDQTSGKGKLMESVKGDAKVLLTPDEKATDLPASYLKEEKALGKIKSLEPEDIAPAVDEGADEMHTERPKEHETIAPDATAETQVEIFASASGIPSPAEPKGIAESESGCRAQSFDSGVWLERVIESNTEVDAITIKSQTPSAELQHVAESLSESTIADDETMEKETFGVPTAMLLYEELHHLIQCPIEVEMITAILPTPCTSENGSWDCDSDEEEERFNKLRRDSFYQEMKGKRSVPVAEETPEPEPEPSKARGNQVKE